MYVKQSHTNMNAMRNTNAHVHGNGERMPQDVKRPSIRLGDEERPTTPEYAKLEPRMADLAASQRQERARKNAIAPKPLGYRIAKRTLDILISALVIAIFAIPGAILAVFIARDTGGGPFYLQERVGKGGKVFKIIKFRTMVADSDNLAKYLTQEQIDEWVLEHKVENDPRITKLGAFLRKTSIDELPNFINSFLGQMSIVGPRAVSPEEIVWYSDDANLLLSVPSGITGLWQVRSRNQAQYETGERQALELEYVRRASLGLDAKIFFQTFTAVLSKTGQ